MSLAALGVVYGDIGTSPLYALREAFSGPLGVEPTPDSVLGILSLVLWALILIVSVKYLGLALRCLNEGEGGILALNALVGRKLEMRRVRLQRLLVLAGLFGAALFYGDGIITPAISVLGAVDGLEVAAPHLEPFIIPLAVFILAALFAMQRHGTGRLGGLFGPLMALWFIVIAVLGLAQIIQRPDILGAVNPVHALGFLTTHKGAALPVLGAVFLVVTGSEALYADVGHFGAGPIRISWFGLVLPALLLNYFGQGALLLARPGAAADVFYHMAPRWSLVPLLILATCASIIASQAVISGAFSMTMQAIQLGYLPRLRVVHTSSRRFGQIYVPFVNWALMLATIGVVVGFGSSSRLAAAYGVAVSTTMLITTFLLAAVAIKTWHRRPFPLVSFLVAFLAVDLAFFSANIIKTPDGGWFPLAVGLIVVTLMTTWRAGRERVRQALWTNAIGWDLFVGDLREDPPRRVRGTAIFMSADPDVVPRSLLVNLQYNRVLHRHVGLLTVITDEVSHVPASRRVEVLDLGLGFCRIRVHYGFTDAPDLPRALAEADLGSFVFEPEETTFFLARDSVEVTRRHGPLRWRDQLFSWMLGSAQRIAAFFSLPFDQVIEVGEVVEI